ncbi:MAG TPA: ExeM/NucH family extracellular endonuclease [Xanthomonadales bacterium]|nr:ExeM/NucH family extracellular endonuclease [Xanthomonadales bacterium]
MRSSTVYALLLFLAFCGVARANDCNPDFPVTPIHDVQGSGSASPLDGWLVTIEGIVVGDFQDGRGRNGDLNGFAVQEQWRDTDSNPATSEGVFVFDGTPTAQDVAVGDQVCVTGRVQEYFDETQVDATVSGGGVVVLRHGRARPRPRRVRLPAPGIIINDDGRAVGDLERFEGERVRVVGNLKVTNLQNLDRFGEITLSSGGRLKAFTQTNLPDAAGFDAWNEDAARRSLRLDDGLSASWPDPIPYPPPALGLSNGIRTGDTARRLIGVMTYRRADGPQGDQAFRLMPTVKPRFRRTNPRPIRSPRVRGDVKVASFNLEFFLNGDGGDPASFPLGGGQTTFTEYQRQRAKLVEAIVGMDADIVGLIELENDYLAGPMSAIQDLVNGINTRVGAGTYEYLDPNDGFGTSPLMVGLLYKPATVTPVGPLVWLYTDAFANPNGNIFKLNRPALTQTFDTAIGAFTVSVNHFKSKGCSPAPTGLDMDQGDGQACFNDSRAQGAVELLDWFANDPTGTTNNLGMYDPDVLIIGDLNSHPAEDPIAGITSGWDGVPGTSDDWVDLLSVRDYSFVFQGQASRLDYAIASPSLASQVSRAAVWHINADEPRALGYSEDNPAPAALYAIDPYRSSDHDAILIGLDGGSQ